MHCNRELSFSKFFRNKIRWCVQVILTNISTWLWSQKNYRVKIFKSICQVNFEAIGYCWIKKIMKNMEWCCLIEEWHFCVGPSGSRRVLSENHEKHGVCCLARVFFINSTQLCFPNSELILIQIQPTERHITSLYVCHEFHFFNIIYIAHGVFFGTAHVDDC